MFGSTTTTVQRKMMSTSTTTATSIRNKLMENLKMNKLRPTEIQIPKG